MTGATLGWGGVAIPRDALRVDVVNVRTSDLSPLAELTGLEVLRVDWTDPHRRPPGLPCDLGPLAGLANLRVIALPGLRILDLAPLAELRALEELDVTGADVTDLSPLAGLPLLRDVVVDRCPVTHIAPLVPLRSLSRLSARDSPVDDEEIERFRSSRPDVELHVGDEADFFDDLDLTE